MFQNQFGQSKEQESLANPIDESKPSFNKSLKQIFRDLYDLTGQSKIKATTELLENLMEQELRIVLFGVHLSYFTGIEDFM